MPLIRFLLPGQAGRTVPSALLILCVIVGGAALWSIGSALSLRWLHRAGFGIGVVGTIVLALYLWWRLYIGSQPPEQDERSPH